MATEYKLSYTATEIDEKLGKIDNLATKNEVPTKTSQLTNDSGFLTSVPDEYVTETELSSKGYLTEHQDLSSYALKTEIPTVVSDLQNDSGYLTSYTETDPTVPAWAKANTKPSYTASEVGAASIEQVELLQEEKANKSGLTLGVHTDGLVYLFIDGTPHGNGLDIKADVVEGDVFGYVDENNVVVLNGALAEGTYTIKYEMEDGATVNIGNLVLDTNVYYTVTNALTNCTNSNSAAQAAQGGSYSATISASSGYELSSVKVTMGGTDISATAVSGGKITIANVTGNIVITATAVVTGPAYTNLLPLAVDESGNDFKGTNGEDGYKTGYKMSTTSGNESALTEACCSGFIPLTDIYDKVRIKNIELSDSAQVNNIIIYNSAKEKIYSTPGTAGAFTTKVSANNGIYSFQASSWIASDAAFFRFSCAGITDETIVTVNEEIV